MMTFNVLPRYLILALASCFPKNLILHQWMHEDI